MARDLGEKVDWLLGLMMFAVILLVMYAIGQLIGSFFT